MTKNDKSDLLIKVAITAVSWGEGADFEWRELVWRGLEKPFQEHYGVVYPMEDDYCVGDTFNETEYGKAQMKWNQALMQLKKDTLAYLEFLHSVVP